MACCIALLHTATCFHSLIFSFFSPHSFFYLGVPALVCFCRMHPSLHRTLKDILGPKQLEKVTSRGEDLGPIVQLNQEKSLGNGLTSLGLS